MNHLVMPVEVFCKTEELSKSSTQAVHILDKSATGFTHLATILPNEAYPLPLFIAYHCRIFVAPGIEGYAVL